MPRIIRRRAAVFAPIPPSASTLTSSPAINSDSFRGSPTIPSKSMIAAVVELEGAAVEAAADHFVPHGRFAAARVRAAPRRSRSRASRCAGPAIVVQTRTIPPSARTESSERPSRRRKLRHASTRRRRGGRSAGRSDGAWRITASSAIAVSGRPGGRSSSSRLSGSTPILSGLDIAPVDVMCAMRPSVRAIAG